MKLGYILPAKNYKKKHIMKNIKIQKWLIDEKGIHWQGNYGCRDYFISRVSIESENNSEPGLYDWLQHMSNKSWMKDEDVFALNTAFIVALELYGFGNNPEMSISRSVKEQQFFRVRICGDESLPEF